MATLGFHEHFAIRLLNAIGAGPGDYLAAVTINPAASAVEAAWKSLSGIATRLGLGVLSLLEVDPRSLEGAVASLVDFIVDSTQELGLEAAIIEATGGARILTVTALLAALTLTRTLPIEVYIQSDTGEVWKARVDAGLLEALTTPLSPEKARILKAITENPGATPQAIAAKTGMHPKTVMNHLAKLKKMKLVIQKGRNRGLYPTPRAKLALHKARALQEPKTTT